jgi:transposase-like protein
LKEHELDRYIPPEKLASKMQGKTKEPRRFDKKGFNAKGNQKFKCKTCGVRFPGTKGTLFYNRHLTEEQIIRICKLLVEKNGVRAIERIM